MSPGAAEPRQSPKEISRALDVRNRHIKTHLPALREVGCMEFPLDSDRYAIFVDVKRSPYTEFALRNVMHFLGDSWGLQIFVPSELEPWISRLLKDWTGVRINTLSYGTAETGEELVNSAFRQLEFWNNVMGDWQLFFSSDSMLCREGIEEFMHYDYIGAPWPNEVISPWCRVGGGGLSLRRKRTMIDVCKTCNTNPWIIGAEDAFFSISLHLAPEKYDLPTVETARRFSVERLFHPSPLAVHRAWHHITVTQLDSILRQINYRAIRR